MLVETPSCEEDLHAILEFAESMTIVARDKILPKVCTFATAFGLTAVAIDYLAFETGRTQDKVVADVHEAQDDTLEWAVAYDLYLRKRAGIA